MRHLPRFTRTAALASAGAVAASAIFVASSVSPVGEPASAAPVRSQTAPTQPAQPSSAGVLLLDDGDLDATGDAWRGNYVVLQPWESARIPGLKARNPQLEVLMYKNVAAVRMDSHGSGTYSTGVSYDEAQDNGWLLSDADGRGLQWSDWSDLYPTDVGDPGYQDRWLANVTGELGSADWDGVMMDDTLTYLSHPTVNGLVSTQIPTDQAMYDATESFLARVSGPLGDGGYLIVPNLTVREDTWQAVLGEWTPYVSGWENEYFVKWGYDRWGDRFAGDDWAWKVDMADWLAARDVPLLAVTYSDSDDVPAELYHRATWLLTWNGRTGSSIFVPDQDDVTHWSGPATAEIGTPTQARHLVGTSGVWRRDYTGGTVLVNPTTTAQTVAASPGSRTLDGTSVSEVLVPATSGVILSHP